MVICSTTNESVFDLSYSGFVGFLAPIQVVLCIPNFNDDSEESSKSVSDHVNQQYK